MGIVSSAIVRVLGHVLFLFWFVVVKNEHTQTATNETFTPTGASFSLPRWEKGQRERKREE
jgi:hypothetical protein